MWDTSVNASGMQIYEVQKAVAATAQPETACKNVESLLTDKPSVTVQGAGTIVIDFGLEHAAWFEFESPDLGEQVSHVTASISEYNEPWPGKTRPLTVYGNGTYRLETNGELYEGVRYAWINFHPAASRDQETKAADITSWTITAARLVAQVRPVPYTGSFKSADPVIEKCWYSGAYGTRLNMHEVG
jgi:hypothetical protein